jgi:hypothetical protein
LIFFYLIIHIDKYLKICYFYIKIIILDLTGKTSNLIEVKALNLLDNYNGKNNYIIRLKNLKEQNKKFYPTRSQSEYIINYYNVEPKVAKKWVNLEPYFAKKIADEKNMLSIPTDIWVEKLLVDKDKSYHIWGKFNTGDTITDMWLPKAALLKTHNTEEVKIDYNKYSHRPPLEHQKVAIEKLVGSKRFILADDMGVGKTTSAVIATLETGAKKIVTDSGGVQKEAFFLGKPCITMRDETEWVETVENGWNVIVGANAEKIKDAIVNFNPANNRKDYFGNGNQYDKSFCARCTWQWYTKSI